MAASIVQRIRKSGLSIYDPVPTHLRLSDRDLERILKRQLSGLNLDYAIRTRSKVLKSAVCDALGYPIPEVFRKSRPRFPGQDFDTYVQKADNLQIWNEDVNPTRRYVIVRPNQNHVVTGVRVLNGETIARLDRTGTLTQKYQASAVQPVTESMLLSRRDTAQFLETAGANLLPIQEVFNRLRHLEGQVLPNPARIRNASVGRSCIAQWQCC